MQWYYARGQEQVGPLDEAAFAEAVRSGSVQGDTLVWHEGLSDWTPHADLAPRGAGPSAPPAGGFVACAECGRSFPEHDTVAYRGLHVCAACKPVFFQKLQEGAPLPNTLRYAGFWVRAGARILDGVLAMAGGILISLLLGNDLFAAGPDTDFTLLAVDQALTLLFTVFYSVYFTGRFGGTPGKLAFGLRVVRPGGAPITYLRALGRFFADWISMFICYIGYLMAAFDDQKQALHDRICDTRVVFK